MITPILTAIAGFFGSPAPVIQAPPPNAHHQPAAQPQSQQRTSNNTIAFRRFLGSDIIFPPARQGMSPFDFARTKECAKLHRLNRTRRWRQAGR